MALGGPARGDDVPPPGPLTEHLERAFAAAAERIAPSVVALDVERDPAPASPDPSVPSFLRRPGGLVSGLAVSERRVLTSAWNVEGAAGVRVVLADGRRLEARILARDEGLDLALLEVAAEGAAPLPAPASLDPGSGARVGAWLIAVGRGPDGASVVNTGIVSALGRFRGEALQTDAALNYGNYGGAAVDLEGRIVGIPVRLSPLAGVNSGVGFVIPAERAREALERLGRGESRARPVQAFLGVRFGREVEEPAAGVEVAEVIEGSAAARGGLEPRDVLLKLGETGSLDAAAASDAIQERRPGDRMRIEVLRQGRRLGLEVTLGERTVER